MTEQSGQTHCWLSQLERLGHVCRPGEFDLLATTEQVGQREEDADHARDESLVEVYQSKE